MVQEKTRINYLIQIFESIRNMWSSVQLLLYNFVQFDHVNYKIIGTVPFYDLIIKNSVALPWQHVTHVLQ